MSEGTLFLLIVAALFPTIIIVAVVVKLWEVRKARRWPSTEGKVIATGVTSHVNQPGDPGYDFHDTEVSNEPRVEYEYQVAGRKYRGQRITIGEKTSGYELEAILACYPVGTAVTVYYDPADPQKAVLERELPASAYLGIGCLLLFFIGGPLLAALVYFNAVAWLKPYLANPDRAPFVAATGGFGLVVLFFAFALTWQTGRWPIARGRIVASGVESFQKFDTEGRRTHFRPRLLYTYEVKGRRFKGDRVTLAVVVSATFPALARGAPPGTRWGVKWTCTTIRGTLVNRCCTRIRGCTASPGWPRPARWAWASRPAGGKREAIFPYNFLQGDLYMKRVNVDSAASAVKEFIRSLELDANGVEVTLGGKVVCKIIPPGQLSDTEKAARLAEVRKLLGEARANSKRLPATVIEQNIRNALKTVRGGR